MQDASAMKKIFLEYFSCRFMKGGKGITDSTPGLRGRVGVQHILMQGKKDGRLQITDEVLQCQILVLIMLIIGVLEAW